MAGMKMFLAFDPFLDSSPEENNLNSWFMHRDVNCGFVYTSGKSGSNQTSNDGEIKQSKEYPYKKGSYIHWS